MTARLLGELRERAVVIEPRHGSEVARIEVFGVGARDQCVRVRRIAHDKDLHMAIRDFVECLALCGENLRIGEQQILALHARTARTCTDQQADVEVAERHLRIIRRDDLVERRECAVVQLHHHPVERAQRRSDLQQVQVHRLVGAQHLARRHAKGEGITNLTGGTGDRDVHGLLHSGSEDLGRGKRAAILCPLEKIRPRRVC